MTRSLKLLLGGHFLLVCLLIGFGVFANDYYNGGSFPAQGSSGSSASMRAEFAAITAGFDKLPSFSGNANKFVAINSSATGLTASDLIYSTGTWVPSVGGTATYTEQIGSYTKIGRMVCLHGRLVINLIGTGSQSTVSGLPFTTANTTFQPLTIASTANLALSVTSIQATTSVFGTTFVLVSRTAASTGDAGNNVLGSSSALSVNGCYQASA